MDAFWLTEEIALHRIRKYLAMNMCLGSTWNSMTPWHSLVLQLGASPLTLWAGGPSWAQVHFSLLGFFLPLSVLLSGILTHLP